MTSRTDERLLTGHLADRAALTPTIQGEMLALLKRHFEGVEEGVFEQDLMEKNQAILLRDAEGTLRGFSTLKYYETRFQGEDIRLVFSGDTIVEPGFWGSTALPQTWIKAVRLYRAQKSEQRHFWFLLCSGYRTYHFLRLFFEDFHPRFDRPIPKDLRALRDHVAFEKFGDQYDPERGVVRFHQGAQALKAGIGNLPSSRLKNPHVAFFAQVNPGHDRGDELACVVEIHESNFKECWNRVGGD